MHVASPLVHLFASYWSGNFSHRQEPIPTAPEGSGLPAGLPQPLPAHLPLPAGPAAAQRPSGEQVRAHLTCEHAGGRGGGASCIPRLSSICLECIPAHLMCARLPCRFSCEQDRLVVMLGLAVQGTACWLSSTFTAVATCIYCEPNPTSRLPCS